jgi:hypothetical protein
MANINFGRSLINALVTIAMAVAIPPPSPIARAPFQNTHGILFVFVMSIFYWPINKRK